MDNKPTQDALSGLSRRQVQAGRLAPGEAADLLQLAQDKQSSFVDALLATGLLTSGELAHTLSSALALPLLDLDAVDLQSLPKNLIDSQLAARYRLLVLGKRGGRLFIGSADPSDAEAAERIKFATQMAPEWVIVEHDKLAGRLNDSGSAATAGPETPELPKDSAKSHGPTAASAEVDDAPVIRFLQQMLTRAINLRASDLHFEPYETHYRVRFRVDGELREITRPPLAMKEKLASRIKVLARLDITERRIPQDGRMKLQFGAKAVDFRVSTLPTLHGEKIVIRILDSGSVKLGIEALGYAKIEQSRLLAAIHRPSGMVLMTGPTGAGQTVSLDTCLNLLNQAGVNISTVEDRAEIKAAQTGHLVLSTLHTNAAPRTVTLLLTMGVAAFNIASSVLLITAQQLVRSLCEKCKQRTEFPRTAMLRAGYFEADLDGSWQPYRAVGCPACNNGYRERVGIYQVMPITEAIQRLILAEGSAFDIAALAKSEGVRDLRQSGLAKVRAAVTTLEEVLAATNE